MTELEIPRVTMSQEQRMKKRRNWRINKKAQRARMSQDERIAQYKKWRINARYRTLKRQGQHEFMFNLAEGLVSAYFDGDNPISN